MDITLHIVHKDSNVDFSISNPEKELRRTKPGDIALVYPKSKIKEKPNPEGRLAFIHITGANATVEKLNYLLLSHEDENDLNTKGYAKILSNRQWRIRIEDLPQKNKDDLENNRETVLTWTDAKQYFYSKETELSILDNYLE